MSTYLNPSKPNTGGNFSDCPDIAVEYLNYMRSIRGLSPRTVNAYYIDLRTFFKYAKLHRGLVPDDTPLPGIPIQDIDIAFIKKVDKAEIYDFLYYVTRERDNSAATRARKMSTLKGFFRYLTSKTGQLQQNPVDDMEMPKQKKRLPKYLSLAESKDLLNNIQSDFYERDYCILTLFLNCGMRLSELVGINVTDITGETLRVVGKGNKERIVYLNDACLAAISQLLTAREDMEKMRDNKALFLSKRTGNRLTVRRIQQIVDNCFTAAGLSGKGYSVHKLRHTAATLMYQYGQVDMLALKEILGHVNVATTQIYTHLDKAELKNAAAASPLAEFVAPLPEQNNSQENVDNSVENVDKTENED